MRKIVSLLSVAAAVAAVVALWFYNPVVALLCIPMMACVLTALALMFALPVESRRRLR